jgi:sugar phosphate permease
MATTYERAHKLFEPHHREETPLSARFPEFVGLDLAQDRQLAYHRFRLWRVAVLAAVWYSFYYLGRLNWGFCIPWIIGDLHVTKLEAGVGASVILWSYAAGVFISGRFADRYGARVMDTIGGVGTTILNVVVSFLSTLTGIFVGLGFNGFVQGQAYASTNGMLTQWWPKSKRGFATGLYATSMGVSTLVVWLITGYFATHYGWRAAFRWPLLLFTLPATVIFFVLARSKPQDAGFPPYVETMTDSISARAERLETKKIKGARALLLLFRNWKFMAVSLASLFMYIGRYGLLTWIPLYYVETSGVNIAKIPAATVALPLGMMVGPIVAGWISDKVFHSKRYQILNVYMVCFIAVMLTMGLLGIKQLGVFASAALLVLGGFFVLGAIGTMFTTACDFGGRRMAATAVGTIDLFNYVGAGLQGVLIGGILQATGSWPTVFFTLAGVTCAGILLVNLVRE